MNIAIVAILCGLLQFQIKDKAGNLLLETRDTIWNDTQK